MLKAAGYHPEPGPLQSLRESLTEGRRDDLDPIEAGGVEAAAVPEGFPRAVLPDDCGLMAADGFGAEILRESPDYGLNGPRRKAQSLRFGLAAAERLNRLIDPR